MTFYPAGKVMDLYGRRSVAVPCAAVLGISFVVMPFTHAVGTLTLTAMIMGFGNGIGSGIVMTLAADTSPQIGRPKFLGLWRELSDTGQGIGPLILAAVTAVAGLAAGITVSGVVGFAAAAAMWRFIPRRSPAVRQASCPGTGPGTMTGAVLDGVQLLAGQRAQHGQEAGGVGQVRQDHVRAGLPQFLLRPDAGGHGDDQRTALPGGGHVQLGVPDQHRR